MKRIFAAVLSVIMVVTVLFGVPFNTFAASTGSCGTNVVYKYDLTAGTLVISGSGGMTDYSAGNKAPWKVADCINNIKTITIESGITSIGAYAFQGLSQVESISISRTVETIGERAFESCAVGAVPMTLNIPENVKSIGASAFSGMSKLSAFTVDENNKCFKSVEGVLYDYKCSTLIQAPCRLAITALELPLSVTVIQTNAFRKMYSLRDLYVPAGLNTVGDNIFADNKSGGITVHYPLGSAFDWNIYIKNLNDTKITGICYNPEACADDVSNYTEEVIAPNCISQGYTIHTCGVCGYFYKDNYTDPLEHCYDDGIVTAEPSCEQCGTTTFTCSRCGDKYTENIEKNEHSYVLEKATLTKNGGERCTVCGKAKSTVYCPKTFTLSTTVYTYNGKAKKPIVTVKNSVGKTIAASNYTVSYSNNTKAGKASVKIKFKGKYYSGTKTLYFTIKPKATTISSVTSASKAFTVKWKKLTTQTTGYQIQYSTSSSFSGTKTVTVSKNTTTSKKVTGLKGKKKYYVRVRTYKTVNGTKYYSAWSKAKTVTTK